jgi:hypothetical protein
LTHPGQVYHPAVAPTLPPIRQYVDDAQVQRQQHHQQQQQQQQQHQQQQQQQQQQQLDQRNRQVNVKTEKAVGGVAAVLDYDMDVMVDFVSEMAQGMYAFYVSPICIADIDLIRSVQPGTLVSPAFRKFVSQILSSTRLPSSTILLGLYYLSSRMGMLNAAGAYKTSGSQLYRMLTVALLLGSKFLDDNTFQNRSWSDVSGFAVSELNALETEWLVAIGWKLHVDERYNESFRSWLSTWASFKEKKVRVNLKLTPLDTDVQRQRSERRAFSPAPVYPPHYAKSVATECQQPLYSGAAQYEQSAPTEPSTTWLYPRSLMDRSPPSAPDSGPNTPEYYGLPSATWSYASTPYSARSAQPSNHLPYQVPSYTTRYTRNVWNNGHARNCVCSDCYRQTNGFANHFMAQQTVVG